MANLTKATTWDQISRGFVDQQAHQATNAVQFYAGGLVFLDRATGRVVKPADTATYEFLGLVKRNVLGDTSATPIPEVEVNTSGDTLQRVTVTGASAITDVGDRVYIASTDNPNDLTKTATTNTGPIGWITRWYSGTTCDVKLMTPAEYLAQEDVA
jgi:hypothetical protein